MKYLTQYAEIKRQNIYFQNGSLGCYSKVFIAKIEWELQLYKAQIIEIIITEFARCLKVFR